MGKVRVELMQIEFWGLPTVFVEAVIVKIIGVERAVKTVAALKKAGQKGAEANGAPLPKSNGEKDDMHPFPGESNAA